MFGEFEDQNWQEDEYTPQKSSSPTTTDRDVHGHTTEASKLVRVNE